MYNWHYAFIVIFYIKLTFLGWIYIMTKRISVYNKTNNNFKTLQKFKNLVNDEGIIQDYKKKQFYTKPSVAKILKRENAERQRAKDFLREIKNLEKNSDDIF